MSVGRGANEPMHVLPEFACEAIPADAYKPIVEQWKKEMKDKNTGKSSDGTQPSSEEPKDKTDAKTDDESQPKRSEDKDSAA